MYTYNITTCHTPSFLPVGAHQAGRRARRRVGVPKSRPSPRPEARQSSVPKGVCFQFNERTAESPAVRERVSPECIYVYI